MASRWMRAARFYGPGQPLRLENVPLPRPAHGEALIRVRAAGICHTELHMLDGVLNLGVVPLIPGHEVVGDVVEVRGPSQLQPGQRVLLSYYAPCGDCALCRSGAENLCPNASRQFGFTADGGYGEFMVAPSRSLLPLPTSLADAEAVGLACGGATALHAARAIAQVRLGETVVVYGVGGVGFYLIQICRLAGARVLAIGRTPEKLNRAEELGADACIDAREVDPLAAVHDLTGGDGADVVFDLVASAETMGIAPRMLARRGRLVFAGYGEDRAQLNPLWLVLREIQIRGAVGNTFSELRETVDLAGRGLLKSVVGPTFSLDEANDALATLRSGQVIGRAVIRFDREGRVERELRPVEFAAPAIAANGKHVRAVATRGDSPSPTAHAVEIKEAGLPGPGAALSPPRRFVEPAQVPWNEAHPFETRLLEFVAAGVDAPRDDASFNDLALGIFAYQYARNRPYQLFCDRRRATPQTVSHWTEVPAVPIGAFKEVTLATEPIEHAEALFMSSGTTRPENRSRHYHPTLAVYNASIRTNFAAHVVPDSASLPFLVLNPRPASLPNSSLAYYLGVMLDNYGATGSDYFVDENGLDHDRLRARLREAIEMAQPVCLLGTTFAFVHFVDRLAEDNLGFVLPPGSRLFDTGGVKGRSREIGREEFGQSIAERLGIPLDWQVNMYGLTELSTQFIDLNIRQTVLGLGGRRRKSVPPWARTRVLDPETLAEVPPGTVGVLCHTDLANRASVCTILTEDLGVAVDDGFEILGRVKGSQARGCSIAMDELLSATGNQR
jgi:D-arabinose 1-dehydrogenase-like Zn-dependent alcohol dehydrogenase